MELINSINMMNRELYYQYNPWWEGKYTAEFIARPVLQAKIAAIIKEQVVLLLTGLRRVGKTTLMKMQIQILLQQNILPEHIFYISLDDYQLKDDSILDIIGEYRKLHTISSDVKVYVFLDEVTYKKDFRIQLKNLYDQGVVQIIASSSSSSALRDQRGYLTGRERIIAVDPLNFNEYLVFRNIHLKKRDASLAERYFEDYMQFGGIPEYVLNQNREYLTALVEDILYKDIVGIHGVKHPQIIENYFRLLMERTGKQISVNKIANILDISPDTAGR